MTNAKTKTKTGSAELAKLLAELNQKGGFPISVLADRHGFPLASACAAGQDPDKQAAVVALVQKTARQASTQLGLAATDEISLYDAQGQRLVCRPFEAEGHEMILAVLVTDRNKTYRRLTTQVIRAIQDIWKL